ncbi:hypothetical protein FRX31_034962 [Thalictrum thalictroides]|uniref:Uncharacterized protein n=1 Tax=Thalictrum thalictroides TaxID=46969 RepID=A0A7J6USN3_THATH|nr:hypothetical protein FRX31_034962 [Thalictrum thalictroides]
MRRPTSSVFSTPWGTRTLRLSARRIVTLPRISPARSITPEYYYWASSMRSSKGGQSVGILA